MKAPTHCLLPLLVATFSSGCVICQPIEQSGLAIEPAPSPWPALPITTDLESGAQLRDEKVTSTTTSVSSEERYSVVVSGGDGNASNRNAGVAIAAGYGTAFNQTLGVAYAPQGGNASGGAQTVAYARGGMASTQDGGVSVTKNYGKEASVGNWGVAYALTPGFPGSTKNGKYAVASGGTGSVLVFGGQVRRNGKLCTVMRVAQVGTWVDWQLIKPFQKYTLNEKGRIVPVKE